MSGPLRARRLHAGLGVGFGAVFAILAATGVLLHFEDYLEPAPVRVPADLRGADPLPLDALVERAAQRLGGPPQHLELPDEPSAPVMLQRGLDKVFYSRGGAFLEARSMAASWRFVVMAIHSGGLAKRPGEWLATLTGLALLGSLVTGIAIWPRLLRARRRRQRGASPPARRSTGATGQE